MVEKVTPRQFTAITALLATGKVPDAARAAGVAPKTVYAWLKQPAFQAELATAEGQALRSLSRQLAGLGDQTAAALRDALHPDNPIGVRLRAADMVLARGLVLAELVTLEERITRLEEAKR